MSPRAVLPDYFLRRPSSPNGRQSQVGDVVVATRKGRSLQPTSKSLNDNRKAGCAVDSSRRADTTRTAPPSPVRSRKKRWTELENVDRIFRQRVSSDDMVTREPALRKYVANLRPGRSQMIVLGVIVEEEPFRSDLTLGLWDDKEEETTQCSTLNGDERFDAVAATDNGNDKDGDVVGVHLLAFAIKVTNHSKPCRFWRCMGDEIPQELEAKVVGSARYIYTKTDLQEYWRAASRR